MKNIYPRKLTFIEKVWLRLKMPNLKRMKRKDSNERKKNRY